LPTLAGYRQRLNILGVFKYKAILAGMNDFGNSRSGEVINRKPQAMASATGRPKESSSVGLA